MVIYRATCTNGPVTCCGNQREITSLEDSIREPSDRKSLLAVRCRGDFGRIHTQNPILIWSGAHLSKGATYRTLFAQIAVLQRTIRLNLQCDN